MTVDADPLPVARPLALQLGHERDRRGSWLRLDIPLRAELREADLERPPLQPDRSFLFIDAHTDRSVHLFLR